MSKKYVQKYNKCTIVRVLDGDTFDAIVDLGFYVHRSIRIRLALVDAPEVRGRGKKHGKEIREEVAELLEGKCFPIVCYGKGKYGRWICDLSLPN